MNNQPWASPADSMVPKVMMESRAGVVVVDDEDEEEDDLPLPVVLAVEEASAAVGVVVEAQTDPMIELDCTTAKLPTATEPMNEAAMAVVLIGVENGSIVVITEVTVFLVTGVPEQNVREPLLRRLPEV